MKRATYCTRALVLVAAIVLPRSGIAQSRGTLQGLVLDAASNQPVPNALVTLESAATLMSAGGLLSMQRSVVTGASGGYRFTDVDPGSYRLRIERLGYRAEVVEVDVLRPSDTNVSVGLEIAPIILEPVTAQQRGASLFQRAQNRSSDVAEARVATERLRQDLFLSPDSRLLTYADVVDGVTLGEGDVFRAIQRLAGVGTRDDYTAELWTRGAPWTQTSVSFDGVPLFNPVHAVGLLSAVSPEVLGSVFFHSGARPASVSGGAAGVVELRSRPAAGDGELRGVADVSLASSKLVLEQRRGPVSWLVGARHSHVATLSRSIDMLGSDSLDLPYLFRDATGRLDLELGRNERIDVSGLWEEDRIVGDVEGVLERTRARWGNTAAQATFHATSRGLDFAQSAGRTHFHAHSDARTLRAVTRVRTAADPEPPTWSEPASSNDVVATIIAGQIAKPRTPAGLEWSAGYDVAFSRIEFDGPLPRFHPVKPDTTGRLNHEQQLTVAAVWFRMRTRLGKWSVEPGLRLEGGTGILDAAPVRAAPSIAVRYAPDKNLLISLSAGRNWQYTQAIALAGPSVHPAFHASHYWVLADAHNSAIRADIVSASVESWLGNGVLAGVSAYARASSNIAVAHPDSGLLEPRRDFFAMANGNARGVELSLRRPGIRTSASLSYALASSRLSAQGLEYPSSADRRHTIDAMAGVRLLPSVRVAAAFTAMSGAPFTRAYSRSEEDCELFGFGCDDPRGSWTAAPQAERTPDYRSLDLSLHVERTVYRAQFSAYLQVRNVLNRDNASTYSGSSVNAVTLNRRGDRVLVWDDRFERGLPRMPLAGLRVAF